MALADRDAARRLKITWSTETKHSMPVLPVFSVKSLIVEVRVTTSPTRSGSTKLIAPPAHIRRGNGTGGRNPPRLGWPSAPTSDNGTTGSVRHQCAVNGAASPSFGLPTSRNNAERNPATRCAVTMSVFSSVRPIHCRK